MPQRRSQLTPQYNFDDATGQYRSNSSGRFVPRDKAEIFALLGANGNVLGAAKVAGFDDKQAKELAVEFAEAK